MMSTITTSKKAWTIFLLSALGLHCTEVIHHPFLFQGSMSSLEELASIANAPALPAVPGATNSSSSSSKIDENFQVSDVYYINMDKNVGRRQIMEEWLSGSGLSYQRFPAITGDLDSCKGPHNHTKGCIGLSGLSRTVVKLIDVIQEDAGNTLTSTSSSVSKMATQSKFRAYPYEDSVYVLEDDYYLNFSVANEYVRQYVPDDWEVVRFNPWVWHPIPTSFRRVNNYTIRNSREGRPCSNKAPPKGVLNYNQCWFCGGTHAMLWRISALNKLRELWSKQPYHPIDCRLATDSVIGYLLFTGNDTETRKEYARFIRPVNDTSDVSGLKR